MYHADKQGVPLPSELAHFLLLGYSLQEFPGRGYLEALGEGFEVRANEVWVIAHLASVQKVNNTLLLLERRPFLAESEFLALVQEIKFFEFQGLKIEFVPVRKSSGFLKISGNPSPYFTDSDPFYPHKPLIAVEPICAQAQNTSQAVSAYLKWVFSKLESHPLNFSRKAQGLKPVNMLITQRPGQRKGFVNWTKKWGLKGLCIASQPLYKGLAKALGWDFIQVQDRNDPGLDLAERIKLALELEYDFVHVHTKAPDEAGHKKDPLEKARVIASLDQGLEQLRQAVNTNQELLLVITADHSTACSGNMIHTGESVPICMVGQYVRRDKVNAYNEVDCALGGLGIIKGDELMHLILNFLNRAKLKGLMDTPWDQPYYPGTYKPFTL